jgi:hypothetical protein
MVTVMKKLLAIRCRTGNAESGAIMVFMVIAIGAILALIAFALDGRWGINGSQQAAQAADLTVLTATDAYFREPCNDPATSSCHTLSLDAARTRAIAATKQNRLLSDPNQDLQIVTANCGQNNNSAACLEPGRWSKSGSTWSFNALSGAQRPNAFRVQGHLFDHASTWLAGTFFGVPQLKFEVNSTVYYLPKRTFFLVDMSRSMARDTHRRNDQAISAASRLGASYKVNDLNCTIAANRALYQYAYFYSFETNGSNPGSCRRDNGMAACHSYSGNNPGTGQQFSYPYGTRPSSSWGGYPGNEALEYYCMSVDSTQSSRQAPPASSPPPHYFNDYQWSHNTLNNYQLPLTAIQLLEDRDFSSTYGIHHPAPGTRYQTPYQTYKVDLFRDGSYEGPQPLTAVMKGINAAIETFRQRKHPDDQVSIILFDDRLEWPRVVNLTDDWSYLSTYSDFATTAARATKVLDRTRFHLFPKRTFPVYPPTAANNSDTNATNITLALEEVVHQVGGVDNLRSDADSVVLFTDGFHNCITNGLNTAAPSSTACSDTQDAVAAAWTQLDSYVTTTFAEKEVPVHVVLVGDAAQPNTVDIAENGECLTDARARETGNTLDFVRDTFPSGTGSESRTWDRWFPGAKVDEYDPASSDRSPPLNFQVNRYAYNLAYRTRGGFFPIREQNSSCPAACTTSGYVRQCDTRSKDAQVLAAINEVIGPRRYKVVR